MIAHFYLLAASFHNNANFSEDDIEEKVKCLSEDVELINKYKDSNKLYANYTELYPQIFYFHYTIEDFLCQPIMLKSKGVNRDIINYLQNIINKVEKTNITSNEAKSVLLKWNDEHNCHGLIAFHKVDELDEKSQIIYGINDWYKFRRHFLGLYPKDADFFIDECKKYFPNLFFHERNKTVISFLLKNSTQKIIFYLSELNDKFNSAKTIPYNRIESLKRFNSMCRFDLDASDEGNSGSKQKSDAKEKDTFEFPDKYNNKKKICCDLHLKILKDDFGKVSNDRRIYFNEGIQDIGYNKILVGHIGCHL